MAKPPRHMPLTNNLRHHPNARGPNPRATSPSPKTVASTTGIPPNAWPDPTSHSPHRRRLFLKRAQLKTRHDLHYSPPYHCLCHKKVSGTLPRRLNITKSFGFRSVLGARLGGATAIPCQQQARPNSGKRGQSASSINFGHIADLGRRIMLRRQVTLRHGWRNRKTQDEHRSQNRRGGRKMFHLATPYACTENNMAKLIIKLYSIDSYWLRPTGASTQPAQAKSLT